MSSDLSEGRSKRAAAVKASKAFKEVDVEDEEDEDYDDAGERKSVKVKARTSSRPFSESRKTNC